MLHPARGAVQSGEEPMQFSMVFEAQMVDTSRANEAQVLHDCVDQAVLAEAEGFDRIWAVEHHALKWYAHMSAPETFLAFVAGRTSRIRVGHGVVCLPFRMNHPAKVAERVAMLDVLSKGRMDFGIGKGATVQETGLFQTSPEEVDAQLEESARMIPRMWSEEEFEHHGPGMDIPPRPMLGFGGPEDIEQKNRVYRAAIARRTAESQIPDFPVEHLSALCPAIVLPDGDEARRIGHRAQRYFTEAIQYWYQPDDEKGPPSADYEGGDDGQYLSEQGEALVAYLHEERIEAGSEATGLYNPNHAYGTPADAMGYVQRLVDAGADEIMFLTQMGTVPHEVALETIRQLGREVIPHFR
jgi:alkanesulfonate monooxygenase SsuD/methylene tetrahydromethanopterin reductase-like flavin-dependent oxidoreductase (luciferase family)